MDILAGHAGPPVSDVLRTRFVDPFIAAVTATLAEMAQSEPAVRSVYEASPPRTLGAITAVIRLTPALEGLLVLGFPAPTAAALAARVLVEVTAAPDDDLVRDCMGEVANVVAGQAKTLMAENSCHFAFSTPTLLSGADRELGTPADTIGLVVVFRSEFGDFALQLCLRPSALPSLGPAGAPDA